MQDFPMILSAQINELLGYSERNDKVFPRVASSNSSIREI